MMYAGVCTACVGMYVFVCGVCTVSMHVCTMYGCMCVFLWVCMCLSVGIYDVCMCVQHVWVHVGLSVGVYDVCTCVCM